MRAATEKLHQASDGTCARSSVQAEIKQPGTTNMPCSTLAVESTRCLTNGGKKLLKPLQSSFDARRREIEAQGPI